MARGPACHGEDGYRAVAEQDNIENVCNGDFAFSPMIYLPSKYKWNPDLHAHQETRHRGWYKLDENGFYDEKQMLPDVYECEHEYTIPLAHPKLRPRQDTIPLPRSLRFG